MIKIGKNQSIGHDHDLYLDGFMCFTLGNLDGLLKKRKDTAIMVAMIAFWPGEPQPKLCYDI